ncbi:MAG TPA: beta-ketoacyl synthase N-terminal-like domain-containing protein [Mucilaginibacter sp.]|jgi:3-oxoacyl-[acyl-carrier-protein] synthase-1|nr:beta-ketoacyl synthase N-terminal-like domain-containing protein [Mucilaginibacter sp.]
MNKAEGVAAKDVFVVADNVYSPIGKTTAENFISLKKGISGVKLQHPGAISTRAFYASLFDDDNRIAPTNGQTKFERLLIASIDEALNQTDIDVCDSKTMLIISTTKGNISLLETEKYTEDLKKRIALTTSAQIVANHFGFTNKPIVVSNACISGVLAIITGMRLLRPGTFENAVIAGADVITEFILSGFQSFQALSPGVCRPFDRSHDGLNLGEGAATIILSTNKKYAGNIKVKGGSISNDANHISGPSRTGEELAYAIGRSMDDAGLDVGKIDFISAHGTGTVYNDDMEANAVRVSGLTDTPLNSLKGYYGHTLGAAGLIETIVSIESLRQGLFIGTPGFEKAPELHQVSARASNRHIKAQNFLKTASGFGGCNAAVIFGK